MKRTRQTIRLSRKPRLGQHAGGTTRRLGTLVATVAAIGITFAQPMPAAANEASQAQPTVQAVTGLVVKDGITPFDLATTKTVPAVCPEGKRVLGGGARITGSSHVFLTQLRPIHSSNGDRYEVTAIADETGVDGTWSLQAFAVCADPIPGLQIVERRADEPNSRDFQRVGAFCPDDMVALGGGGRIAGGDGQVHLYTVGSAGGTGRDAFAREDSTGFGRNWTLFAYAVCAPVDGVTVETASEATLSDSTEPKSVLAECPPGMRVIGGGAFASDGGTVGHPDIVLTAIVPAVLVGGVPGTTVRAIARENNPVDRSWRLVTFAHCAA
jgi:hypothetical protein